MINAPRPENVIPVKGLDLVKVKVTNYFCFRNRETVLASPFISRQWSNAKGTSQERNHCEELTVAFFLQDELRHSTVVSCDRQI